MGSLLLLAGDDIDHMLVRAGPHILLVLGLAVREPLRRRAEISTVAFR